MSNQLTPIGKVNSISYQDLVGLQAGLTRILGERTTDFKNRIKYAANSHKAHTYQGTLENINNRLGLEPYYAISFTSTTFTDITFDFGAIVLSGTGLTTINIPTISITADGFWNWLTLSSIVTAINAIPNCTATLLGPDGPSVQLAKQKNSGWIIDETVTSQVYQLAKNSVYVSGSEIFSNSLTYTENNGIFTFATSPVNLTVSYQYKQMPYNMIASPASIYSLTDPSISSYLINNNELIYQVQEAIQTLMNADGSYWGK